MPSKRYTNEDIINAVKESYSYSDVCRKVGISPRGGNASTIKRKIQELNLDISHFTFGAWSRGKTANSDSRIRKKDIHEILIKDSGWSSDSIKKKLIKEGLKEHKCESCGLSTWGGYPIPLELHHINGIHTDNRIENLVILCPNCHAMTENFSKHKLNTQENIFKVEIDNFKDPVVLNQCEKLKLNQKYLNNTENNQEKPKVKKDPKDIGKIHEFICPQCGKTFLGRKNSKFCSQKCTKLYHSSKCSKEQLIEDFKELHSYCAVGRKHNVSDNTVRKWVLSYDILDEIQHYITHKIKTRVKK